jgi:phosphoribosylformylglycinamidine synthase
MRSKLSPDLVAFVKAGKPIFGVCNGFQVLVEAGLLPALGGVMTDRPEAVLATNDSGHYECRPSLLKLENRGSCVFTRGLGKGQIVTFISAHAEGKLLLPKAREKRMLKELIDNDQIVFRFVDDRGKYAGYPWNPSGTTFNIAALCNRDGNVFGVQPHPERCFFRQLHPDWTRRSDGDRVYGDGKAVFEGVLDYVARRF